MQIRTARLILRPARADDLDDMHAILSDPRAMTWWSSLPHETLDQTRDWLNSMIDRDEGEGALDFLVEKDGRVIGKAGFWRPPELGYILHPDTWGHGLATEALTAVINHLFAVTEFQNATADVDPENLASIRLLDRLGFVRTGAATGTWTIGGVAKDSVYFAISAVDWDARRKA